MSNKKDMRRPDLIIPFQLPVAKDTPSDISGTLSSTLPMAAMFTRNKFMGWASVVFAIQYWLGESAEKRKTTSQPAYFSVGMAFMALVVTYLPMFLPPPSVPGQEQERKHQLRHHHRKDSCIDTDRQGVRF